MKWYILIIIGIFLLDFIYKNFFEKKKKKITLRRKSDSYYDEEDLKFKSINNMNNNNTINISRQNINISNLEKITQYEFKEKKINSDEDEFESVMPPLKKKTNITIIYDPKLYKDKFISYSKYLDGNYSSLNIYGAEFEISTFDHIIAKLLLINQIILCLFIMFFDKFERIKVLFPEILLKVLTQIRMMLAGAIFFIHYFLIKRYEYSWAFEVYSNGKLIYSTINTKNFPGYGTLIKILNDLKIINK